MDLWEGIASGISRVVRRTRPGLTAACENDRFFICWARAPAAPGGPQRPCIGVLVTSGAFPEAPGNQTQKPRSRKNTFKRFFLRGSQFENSLRTTSHKVGSLPGALRMTGRMAIVKHTFPTMIYLMLLIVFRTRPLATITAYICFHSLAGSRPPDPRGWTQSV